MDKIKIKSSDYIFKGDIQVPADKSIGHRALFIASLNKEMTKISNLAMSEDVRTISSDLQTTIKCLADIGVQFAEVKGNIFVRGRGAKEFVPSEGILDCGNSGTTARLIIGLLSGQKFESKLDGDSSLRTRPMNRVIQPLEKMGASISSTEGNLPLVVSASQLKGGKFNLELGSAQVKTALIFAALCAEGETRLKEIKKSRNHTEIMLKSCTNNLTIEKDEIIIQPEPKVEIESFDVPGDPSSAAFFIVAALINKNSELIIRNVCLNSTRIHFIEILKKMGGEIETVNAHEINGELIGDILVKSSNLKSIKIEKDSIPMVIDEIPILSLACALAEGTSEVLDAGELRFKESDRIRTTVSELRKLGSDIEETDDGILIKGKDNLKGSDCESHMDHRIAMMIAIAGTIAKGVTSIKEPECVSISFPNFFETLNNFRK
ncbi:3-phosphoshikimate 1-carboxyvinyltransferase [bacterium]|jgi:3-phosphoshikimate 1-carboxyvinyltransferase|nr:3-phosphoshikimate 1-carboxyvinyltransferase [bacterium]MBT3794945.1 3-phosphoshikimate 1-carboxyvinyltransferase [bacterium]MBT4634681.1 3-phosphoshikimate 1-carboxyvinyltransferase [bacterium]